jgi:hypothetical protein
MTSPGMPTTRLTKVPEAPQAVAAARGGWNATMSPRLSVEADTSRTITRSSSLPSQNDFGSPQWMVGSIEADSMR